MGKAETDPSAAKGTRLGNYIIGDHLASGGMAEIYFAESLDRRFDTPIVIKRMLPHLAKDRSFVDMFIDEARISTRLDHPNIVRVYDFEATESGLCLIMELVDGPDLLAIVKRCVKQHSYVPEELAAYVACHTLEALDYAHSTSADGRRLNIVHRDVSPSNILVTRRGHVKLADFGIARAAERQHETATGTLKGKYGYMSPEQILGQPLDGRSDVFSMGIVLAEMITGRRLFAAASDLELLLMVRRADLSRLDKYGKHIPAELDVILRKALQRNRDRRYTSAGQFRDALADWLATCSRRSGASRLASFIRGLETQGGDLCKWRQTAKAPTSSPTLSGTETQLARIAIKKRAKVGAEAFADATGENAAELIANLTLEPYDAVPSVAPAPTPAAPVPTKPVVVDDIDLTEGKLDKVHVVDLLCEIGRLKLDGLLTLEQDGKSKEAYFVDGDPEFVRSNIDADRFGEFLVRREVLTPAQLVRVIAALPHFDGRIGQALVSLKLLKPVDAVRLLAEQVEYKIVDACSWRSGTYRFERGKKNPWPALALQLNTLEIIARCLHTIPGRDLGEWARTHRREKPLIDLDAAADFDFAGSLAEQLASFTGTRTLLEVAKAVPATSGRQRLVAAIYVLWRCHVLEFCPHDIATMPTKVAPPPESTGRERREHQRVALECDGSMELCGRSRRQTVLVRIRSATFEGMGLRVIGNKHYLLRRDERVVLRFERNSEHLELPARIAWCKSEAGHKLDFGVKLQLALATAKSREAYAEWVVELIACERLDKHYKGSGAISAPTTCAC